MATNRLRRELRDFEESPDCNCGIYPLSDDLYSWRVYLIGPKQTPYEDYRFDLQINFTLEYPFKPPLIRFITPIYHPNIDRNGHICMDTLRTQWSPALSVLKLLLSISSLLAEPNPKDPLVQEIAHEYLDNNALFRMNARRMTRQYATPVPPGASAH